jgi:dimethylamine/trimethylamine dehydrogenase
VQAKRDLATGSTWRRDGRGRDNQTAISGLEHVTVYTPDDIMDGVAVSGKVVIYDLDYYYLATTIAAKLRAQGQDVSYVTDGASAAHWTAMTLEQARVQTSLIENGVELHLNRSISATSPGQVTLNCTYTGRPQNLTCDTLVLVTERLPADDVYLALKLRPDALECAGIKTLELIGDA